MKKLLLALALLLAPAAAWGQCSGVFPANTVCGNNTGVPAVPTAIVQGGAVSGPGSSTVGHFATWGNTTGTLLADFNLFGGTNVWTGTNTYNAAVNFTSTFQISSATKTFPSGAVTLGGLSTNQTWTGNNTFSTGTVNFTGTFQVGTQTFTWPAAGTTVAGLGTSQTFSGNNIFNGTTTLGGTLTAAALATPGVIAGSICASSGGSIFYNVGANCFSGSAVTKPTIQRFTSGSGTYTSPGGASWLKVKIVGGGGGGGARSANAGTGGGTTTYGSWTAIGGSGGVNSSAGSAAGGAGGTGGATGTGTLVLRLSGAAGGHGGPTNFMADSGGASCLGGAGIYAGNGQASAAANSGSGGSGGSDTAGPDGGGGGGGGECVEFIVTTPANVSYAVGAGGPGGTAGVTAGGNGATGIIVVEEHYEP